MPEPSRNRFQDFFEENRYVVLKNYLYNYRLRKRAIEGLLARESYGLILEAGSGISPVMTGTDRIVYSEISPLACRTLRHIVPRGRYTAADVTRLPFREGSFSHALCSEVLEHVEGDVAAVGELARVLEPGGRLIVTFPHRKCYWANDDRFVNHHRRYERVEMEQHLRSAGLSPIHVEKVLGPLEKIAMMFTVFCFESLQRVRPGGGDGAAPSGALVKTVAPLFKWANRAFAVVAWLDARLVPQRWATVLLIVAEKQGISGSPRA